MLTPTQLRRLRQSDVPDTGNRLSVVLDLLEFTQQQLADAMTRAGYTVTQPQVSDVLRGRYPTLTVDTAYKFTRFLGCHIEDVFPAKQAA